MRPVAFALSLLAAGLVAGYVYLAVVVPAFARVSAAFPGA